MALRAGPILLEQHEAGRRGKARGEGRGGPRRRIRIFRDAYYLDYQNRRADYVKAWMGSLVNWDFANANLDA
jgi:hypothetical protein